MDSENKYCVILAGGKGRRLWPSSRAELPKQFIDFFGTGKTQLQQTFDRMSKILPQDHILISTNIVYAQLVMEQLPSLAKENILAEPIHRNTAPSVAWAVHRVMLLDNDASIVIASSDLLIFNEDVFRQDVEKGLNFVENNSNLLVMGVKPTRPEPGYGYIQIGDETRENLHKVKSFTEKPDRQFAKMFMDSGEFYWNTGLFIATAQCLRDSLSALLPSVLRKFEEDKSDFTIQGETSFIMENFSLYPNMTIDFAILEKSNNVCVMRCDFGWADVGTWHGVYEATKRGEKDNVVIDSKVIIDNSNDNIIKVQKGKLAVINGLEGYIVADEGNVLLICKKEDSSTLVRKYVNEIQLKLGDKFT